MYEKVDWKRWKEKKGDIQIELKCLAKLVCVQHEEEQLLMDKINSQQW